jgi:uncharacterized membrane protein YhaH (DUF805 family)
MNEFLKVVKNYVGFSGRAGRREYWMFVLVYMLIYIGLAILTAIMPNMLAKLLGLVTLVFAIGLLIPSIAVGVRRLHDSDHSGWWMLLMLVPLAGLYVLYLLIIEGTSGSNRFGESPVGMIENAV